MPHPVMSIEAVVHIWGGPSDALFRVQELGHTVFENADGLRRPLRLVKPHRAAEVKNQRGNKYGPGRDADEAGQQATVMWQLGCPSRQESTTSASAGSSGGGHLCAACRTGSSGSFEGRA